jgi:hypothetical protein
MIAAQLRHVLGAEGSQKAAVENQHHIFPAAKIGEPHGAIVEISQAEIRGPRI